MQYMLLIHSEEQTEPQGDDREAMYERYFAFSKEVREAGKYVDGAELQPTSAATTVRVRNGEALVTDGPFAETKEQLGGYYLLNCDDIDEAISYAAKIPSAEYGSIEVRPVVER
jgi:hypothetical protein